MQIAAPARVADHERNWKIDQGRRADAARFAPVETRMRNENGDPADKKGKETSRRDPMCDADERRVPRRIEAIGTPDGEPWEIRGLGHNHRDHSTRYRRPAGSGFAHSSRMMVVEPGSKVLPDSI